MSYRYLLDANVLSEPAKPTPNCGVISRLERDRHAVATAAPVWNELLFGCYRLPLSKRRQTLERYLKMVLAPSIPVLPYDSSSAEWHAEERARLTAIGKTPTFVDGQIAAIALVRGLILVTSNESDYTDFDGLIVENWKT